MSSSSLAPRDLREDGLEEAEDVRHDEEARAGHGARAVRQEGRQGGQEQQGEPLTHSNCRFSDSVAVTILIDYYTLAI